MAITWSLTKNASVIRSATNRKSRTYVALFYNSNVNGNYGAIKIIGARSEVDPRASPESLPFPFLRQNNGARECDS